MINTHWFFSLLRHKNGEYGEAPYQAVFKSLERGTHNAYKGTGFGSFTSQQLALECNARWVIKVVKSSAGKGIVAARQ